LTTATTSTSPRGRRLPICSSWNSAHLQSRRPAARDALPVGPQRFPVRAPRLQLEHLTLLNHLRTSSIDNEIEDHTRAATKTTALALEVVEEGASAIRLNAVVRPIPKVGMVRVRLEVRSFVARASEKQVAWAVSMSVCQPDRSRAAPGQDGRQCLAAYWDAEPCVHGVEGPHAQAEHDRDNGG
jgi:hypothetical protein